MADWDKILWQWRFNVGRKDGNMGAFQLRAVRAELRIVVAGAGQPDRQGARGQGESTE